MKIKKKLCSFILAGFLLIFIFLTRIETAQLSSDKWWRGSWHYRFKLIINSTGYDRVDWPVEYDINFTSLLESLNVSGNFDLNSTRVFEYDANGNLLYEVPSQFDPSEDFNSSTNAFGTLVFLMNGTTPANAKRYYYVYFDILENGAKPQATYPTNLTYSWDGQLININNTKLWIYIDTNRSEATSGIYHVKRSDETVLIVEVPTIQRTAEYLEYFNGTHNVSFDLRGNASFIVGPVRLTVKQVGDEIVFGQPNQKTYQARVLKNYYIYNRAGPESYGTFFRITQKIENIAAISITRNSTPAGALAIDVNRSLPGGVSIVACDGEPFSWCLASSPYGQVVGVVNLNDSHSNYSSTWSSSYGRIGVQLNSTTIDVNSFIFQNSIVYAGTSTDEFIYVRNRYATPIEIQALAPESWEVKVSATTDKPIYNRGEAIFIYGNASFDPTNLVAKMNATLDMGTTDTSDDVTIILYNDGTHGDSVAGDKVFTNYFNLTSTSQVGIWNVTVKAYDAYDYFLNESSATFNVTDVYKVNLTITNPTGLAGRLVNTTIYVKNYREDTWIPNATINCSYNGVFVDNYVDYLNGTYSLTFQAPLTAGVYTLNCTANKTGNIGWNTATFTAESPQASVDIKAIPNQFLAENVTWYKSQSFEFLANASQLVYSTAFNSNISLELPVGWFANSTFEQCGNIGVNEFCEKAFNITVASGTPPGNYLVNVSVRWKNYDGTIGNNRTWVNVTVTSNPILEVPEEKISSYVAPGIEKAVGNFTLNSTGNYRLENINFQVIGLSDFTIEFIPSSLAYLEAGQIASIQINVTSPQNYPTGNYSGVINITTSNNGWDSLTLEIIVSGTNLTIDVSPKTFLAENITWYKSQSFEFVANVTNPGNVTAFNSNISLELPPNWQANSTFEQCGNIGVNEFCEKSFNITVASGTPPGNYLVNVSVEWEDKEIGKRSNKTFVNITVTSNPILEVPEKIISNSIIHGTEGILGNFTLNSRGNYRLENINFVLTGLQDFTVEFIPSNLAYLEAGQTTSIQVNVTIPLAYPPGTYYGEVNVTTLNNGWKNLTLEVIVPTSRTWLMQPENCTRVEAPDYGKVCDINITNTGNDAINFTITPPSNQTNPVNYTWVNETNFSIQKQSWHVFSVWYNVTGVPKGFYNTTYNISSVQPAEPQSRNLLIMLVPFVPPTLVSEIKPKKAEQLSYFEIYVNVTDNSGYGMNFVEINVTRPDGKIDSRNMTNIFIIGSLSTWYARYPDSWGNTSLRGNYSVLIRAVDNLKVENTTKDWFGVYAKVKINLTTLKKEYYQGDIASIYFEAKDYLDSPLENANTRISIKSPSNLLVFNQSYLTNSQGKIEPLPTYEIPSDAEIGTYNLSSNLTYFDSSINETIVKENSTTFSIIEKIVGGLFADLEISSSYSQAFMKFWITLQDQAGQPVDAEQLNLTVFTPSNNLLFSTNLSKIQRLDKGFYYYRHNLTQPIETGDYLAVVKAKKGEYETQKAKSFTLAKEGLIASIDTQVVWYPDNTMTFLINVYDQDYNLIDPDSMNLTVYVGSPLLNNIYLISNLSDPRMQKVENGSYILSYVMPASTATGDYWAILKVSKGSLYTVTEKPFRVSKGGPYDVRIQLLETEVHQGDYLDFYITIENKGEVGQDVDLEYWVYGFNQTWFYSSEAVYVEAFSNKTLLRNAYIFTTQPIGTYWLNVKVTYSVVEPPIIKNVTFSVVEKVVPIVPAAPPPVAPPVVVPPGVPRISIVEYPIEISLMAGWTKYPSIKVKNVGEVDLHNVELVVSGLPSDWFSVSPTKINVLPVNETQTFTLTISIPKDAVAKEYIVRLLALSNETKDEKTMMVRVFTSIEELIRFELRKLEVEFEKVKIEVKQAKDVGKDVSEILPLLDEIQAQINAAKKALDEKRYDDALTNINTGWNLIKRVREMLVKAPFIKPLIVPVIPTWLFVLVVVLLALITILLAFLRRVRALLRTIFARRAPEMERIKEVVTPKEERKFLEEERNRIKRTLELLEREYKEGIISDAAYVELKRSNEERLKKIIEKLRSI